MCRLVVIVPVLSLLLVSPGGFAQWQASLQRGSVQFFLHADPARIARYDLAAQTELATIPLSQAASAFAVGESGYYVAHGESVHRYSPAGTDMGVVAGFSEPVSAVFFRQTAQGRHLLVGHGSTLSVLSLPDGGLVDAATRSDVLRGLSFDGKAMVAAREGWQRPVRFRLGEDGSIVDVAVRTENNDFEYYGGSDAMRFDKHEANETLIVEDGGTVFYGHDLSYRGSLGLTPTAIAPWGQGFVAAELGRLSRFDLGLSEAGYLETDMDVRALATWDGRVFAFGETDGELQVSVFESADIPARPTAPGDYDLETVAFETEGVARGHGERYYLLANVEPGNEDAKRSIFIYDAGLERYVGQIPLTGAPSAWRYSKIQNAIYLFYRGQHDLHGRMTRVMLGDDDPAEHHYAGMPHARFCGMIPTEQGLYVCGKGIYTRYYSDVMSVHFGKRGHPLGLAFDFYEGEQWHFDAAADRLYFRNLFDYHFAYRPIQEDGGLGGAVRLDYEAPLVGDLAWDDANRLIATGYGEVISSSTFQVVDTWYMPFLPANTVRWLSPSSTLTVNYDDDLSDYRLWFWDLGPDGRGLDHTLPGSPRGVFPLDADSARLVIQNGDRPEFPVFERPSPQPPADYCRSTGTLPFLGWIAGTTVTYHESEEGIDFGSGRGWDRGYADFTDTVLSVFRNPEMPISPRVLEIRSGYFWARRPLNVGVWIDMNRDGEFTEYEQLFSGELEDTLSIPLAIPPRANYGQTRMRVVARRGDAPEPCGFYLFGETEDYTLDLMY